ncbi:RNA-directed DNA polymerase, eukaryota [Tanacetum coccineum]|uniref:RNA-directed DNA polymerase, eukaryota n=1 Tax=Tanacetum coccineum TaxID=301880 RepID=A0ABQ5FYP4_9ASTR
MEGDVIIMGDFNEVRTKEERFGSIFNAHRAAVFNSFISPGGLVEVPPGGYSFTWSHKSASRMRKIRMWVKDKKDKALNHKKGLKNMLAEIDSSLDKGDATSDTLEELLNIMNKLTSLEKIESLELAQKAKIK